MIDTRRSWRVRPLPFGAVAIAWCASSAHRAWTDRRVADLKRELAVARRELDTVRTRLDKGTRSADIVVWEVNTTTGVTWSSAALDHPDDGIEHSFFERLHPEDRARIESAADPEEGHTRVEKFRLADRRGEYRWILSRCQTVRRGADRLLVGVHIDITEQQRHLEQVEKLNAELIERNEALNDFTRVASHDLRSPLRAVSSLVSFLREDLPPGLGDDIEHHMLRIDERVARMENLLDDLLVYARAHHREDEAETFDVAELAEEILETIDVPKGIVTVIDCDVPPIRLAKTPFTTCMRNLVDNALKHHDKTDGQVVMRAEVIGHELLLAVHDDGPGIETEALGKIFEPFRRLRTDDKSPGSGIGLSVIARSTAAHGGAVDVQSTVGEGSTFTIRWPIDPTIDVTDPAASCPRPSRAISARG